MKKGIHVGVLINKVLNFIFLSAFVICLLAAGYYFFIAPLLGQ